MSRRLWALVPLMVVVPYLGSELTRTLKPCSAASREGLAYPSGHTTVMIVVLGMLVLAVGRRRWLIWAAAVFAALGVIGQAVTYHYFTDAVGALLLGSSLVCLTAVAARWLHRQAGEYCADCGSRRRSRDSVATAFLWLVTTLLLAVALPVLWAQQNLVDRSGYTALTQRAATSPDLRSAAAVELTTQVGELGAGADASVVGGITEDVHRRLVVSGTVRPGQRLRPPMAFHRWSGLGARRAGSLGDRLRSVALRRRVRADTPGLQHRGADIRSDSVDRQCPRRVAPGITAGDRDVGSVGGLGGGGALRRVGAPD